MRRRLVAILSPAIAIVFMSFTGFSSDAQTAEKQKETKQIAFSADALTQTIKELKTTTSVDFFDTTLKDVLQLFAARHDLKFKILTSDSTALVTIKTTGQLGQVFVQLLATIKCEYAILPNGVIVIRNLTKVSSPAALQE